MKAIKALNGSVRKETLVKLKKPKPRDLARFRRDEKIRKHGSRSTQEEKVVIYTRDVSNGDQSSSDIGVISIGSKRTSISNAKNKLARLQARGARPRSIRRMQDRIELCITAEKDRKDREGK